MEVIESDEEIKRAEFNSKRLVLQNYDWSSISPQKIFFLFESFLQKSDPKIEGKLEKLSLYISDFGEKKLKKEKEEGPSYVLEQVQKKIDLSLRGTEEEKQLVETDPLVRQYELDRLKYYYCLLEFSTEEALDYVYSKCDGLDYEGTGMRLDLRVVPEELVIPKQPEEVITNADSISKKDLKDVKIKNLSKCHTNIEFSWDKDIDPQTRTKELFEQNLEDINQDKIKEILASDSENENENEMQGLMKLKALISGGLNQDDSKKNRNQHIDITFKAGFAGNDDEDDDTNIPVFKQKPLKNTDKNLLKREKEEFDLLVDNNKGI